MSAKQLFIITSEFPYGKGETFILDELKELSSYYSRIYVIPYYKRPHQSKRDILENNVEILESTDSTKKMGSFQFLVRNWSLVYEIFKTESWSFLRTKSSLINLKNIFYQYQKIYDLIKDIHTKGDHFYAYWMSAPTTVLALLKRKGLINIFVSRAHGYDVFKGRHENNFIPLLNFNLKYVDHIFANSEYTKRTVLDNSIRSDKVSVSMIGLKDRFDKMQINQNRDTFLVVSVSNIHDFKRVDKIFKVLNVLSHNIPVKWIHFGSGPKMDYVKHLVKKSVSPNLVVELKGNVQRQEIFEFYNHNQVDLFIHLSEIEGFGFAIVEAQSFGIPVLISKVGGTPETISDNSGVMVEVNDGVIDIANLILTDYKNGNWTKRREEARRNFLEKFESKRVVKRFNKELNKVYQSTRIGEVD